MASVPSFREQATRLFAMAMEARDKGNVSLAELLTEAATRFLDQAIAEEAAEPTKQATHEAPPLLQQQQIQPNEEE